VGVGRGEVVTVKNKLVKKIFLVAEILFGVPGPVTELFLGVSFHDNYRNQERLHNEDYFFVISS